MFYSALLLQCQAVLKALFPADPYVSGQFDQELNTVMSFAISMSVWRTGHGGIRAFIELFSPSSAIICGAMFPCFVACRP